MFKHASFSNMLAVYDVHMHYYLSASSFTCWMDRSLGKGLSISSSSLDECKLWVLTWKTRSQPIRKQNHAIWYIIRIWNTLMRKMFSLHYIHSFMCECVLRFSSPSPLCFSYWFLSKFPRQNSPSDLCSPLAALWMYRQQPSTHQHTRTFSHQQ